MSPYRLFLRFEAAEVLREIRDFQRSAVISFIDSLKAEPDLLGDYFQTDDSGRQVQIKVVGRFAITYWPDLPVKEVKVADVRRADRA